LRNPEKATTAAERAVELDGQNGDYRNTLGLCLIRTGQLDKAQREIEQSLKRSRTGGNAFDWYLLAIIASMRMDYDNAQSEFRKASDWRAANLPDNAELKFLHDECTGLMNARQP